MQQLILDIRPEAPPSFDNFLAGQNLEAVATLIALATGGEVEPLVYLWGEAGCGKTHLLHACVRTAGSLGHEARYVARGERLPERLPRLLAVDDVQALDAAGQVALFNLINLARDGRGRIVAAGDLPPARLGLRPDLATRLSSGLVYAIHRPSEAERAAALHARAEARGMRLPEEVVSYLLNHCRRDLPGLLATVDALDAYSLSLKRAVTLPLLREMLQQGQTD